MTEPYQGVSVHFGAGGFYWQCYRPGCLALGPGYAPSFVAANVGRTAHEAGHFEQERAGVKAGRVRQLEMGL